MRLILAFKVFFQVLFNSATAQRIAKTLAGGALPLPERGEKQQEPSPAKSQKPAKPKPKRSEAITLLSALQREARLIDIVQEPLDEYTDEQIGAAARDVMKNCGKVLERFFELQPVVHENEDAEIQIAADFDPEVYRLAGNVSGDPPFRGKLVHHGWKAGKCELPQWNGRLSGAEIVAPAEVEVKG